MATKKIPRREAIAIMGAAGAALALGCGGDSPTPPAALIVARIAWLYVFTGSRG